MASAVSAALACVLILWLVLSAVRYVPSLGRWLDDHDAFLLVPHWSFFAPHPNCEDYYIYVRVGSLQGLSPWSELTFDPTRPWYAGIWNPGRRTRKAVFDLCQGLAQF